MIVVSDTSPINYLVLTGYVDILYRLYGRVIIPQAVQEELTHADTPEPVRQWIQQKPKWLEVHEVAGAAVFTGHLERGEQEALTLAITLKADRLLVDERRGRAAAIEHDLIVIGTLGVLAEAANADLLSLPEAVEKLRQTSYQISERLIEAVLQCNRSDR